MQNQTDSKKDNIEPEEHALGQEEENISPTPANQQQKDKTGQRPSSKPMNETSTDIDEDEENQEQMGNRL